jgi:hypothetical protein
MPVEIPLGRSDRMVVLPARSRRRGLAVLPGRRVVVMCQSS